MKVNTNFIWRELISLNLSENSISQIGATAVTLVPKLRNLNVSHNWLSSVANLSSLSDLEHLTLSNNRIEHLTEIHTRLGNVKSLNLAQNNLRRLDGLSKVYGLVSLDVRCNQISDLETVRCISCLPCLEVLTLTGNSVTTMLDFRTKVLTMFGIYLFWIFIFSVNHVILMNSKLY